MKSNKKLDKKKKKIIVIVVVVVVVLIAVFVAKSVFAVGQGKNVVNTQESEAFILEKRDLEKTISVTGTVASSDTKALSSDISDTLVKEVLIKVGAIVNEGDVICRFDTSELQKKIDTTSKSLDVIKSKKNLDIAAAQRNLDEAKSAKELVIARADKDISEAYTTYTKASGEEAKSAYVLYEKQIRQKEDDVKAAEKTINDQVDNLATAKLSLQTDVAEQDALLLQYRNQLGACEIKATMNGVVTSISVNQGELFKGGEIAVIQNQNDFRIAASVDQYDISDITNDMQATVKTDATGSQKLKGIVDFVSPVPKSLSSSTTTTNTTSSTTSSVDYEIGIKLLETGSRLRIGMSAKVNLILASKSNVFAIPYDFLTDDGDGKYAVMVMENGEKSKIQVEKGLETDYYVEITGNGLKEDMEIVK